MALYIKNIDGYSVEWHLNQPLPTKYIDKYRIVEFVPFYINKVSEIQADGDELEKIKELFHHGMMGWSVPMPNISVVNWFGDTAKTILSALI